MVFRKIGHTWSKPINAGPAINSDKEEFYISFSSKGTMYFSSNKNAESRRNYYFDLYKSDYLKGDFQDPIKLSDTLNTRRYESEVFISPDENMIINCSDKKEGFGKGDLYISFKNKDGHWDTPSNLGSCINTEENEICPFVSSDGKYLFYSSN